MVCCQRCKLNCVSLPARHERERTLPSVMVHTRSPSVVPRQLRAEEEKMNQFTKISFMGACLVMGVLFASASMAAPSSDASPSQDCYSKATLQLNLDYAKCGALPFQTRDPCIIQAVQKYATAVAACATAGTSTKGVTIKQNVDPAFARRLRN